MGSHLRFASRVARQRSETRLTTFDSIRPVLSELRLHHHHPRKPLFVLRRLRQQPSGSQHLRTSRQRVFVVLGVCSLQNNQALEKLDSFNELAQIDADLQKKPTLLCHGFRGSVRVTQLNQVFLDITTLQRPRALIRCTQNPASYEVVRHMRRGDDR